MFIQLRDLNPQITGIDSNFELIKSNIVSFIMTRKDASYIVALNLI